VRGHDRGPVPPHLRGKGTGWVTAEYSMLPRATASGPIRESAKGKIGGRTHEIQRLVGRSLRGVVDLAKLGERTITVDCDVLQADGGTRTASITGGYVALAAALITYGMERTSSGKSPRSASGSSGDDLLDLDYSEDSHADVDFNVVGTDAGTYVELQGTAEGKPFDRAASTACSTWRPPGSSACSRPRPRRSPRSSASGAAVQAAAPAVIARARRDRACSSPPARRTSCASCASCSGSSRGAGLARRLGIPGEAVEDGETFEANARSRPASSPPCPACRPWPTTPARGRRAGRRPGVRTRRYAGEDATDDENNVKLLGALAGLPAERRGARYAASWRSLCPTRRAARRHPRPFAHGTLKGRIATAPRGDGGFGYDPIFEPAAEPPGGRTLGEWTRRGQEPHLASRPRTARIAAMHGCTLSWHRVHTSREIENAEVKESAVYTIAGDG
jgi:ribonuclease PH